MYESTPIQEIRKRRRMSKLDILSLLNGMLRNSLYIELCHFRNWKYLSCYIWRIQYTAYNSRLEQRNITFIIELPKIRTPSWLPSAISWKTGILARALNFWSSTWSVVCMSYHLTASKKKLISIIYITDFWGSNQEEESDSMVEEINADVR